MLKGTKKSKKHPIILNTNYKFDDKKDLAYKVSYSVK